MIICTSICANYIPKARVLATSLKKHNPGTVFVLSLAEDEVHPAALDKDIFDHVILAKDMGVEDFDSFIFRHSIVEASTAVKGHLFKELLRRFPDEDEFVYLDPDILVTGKFVELSETLKSHDIVLTPHLAEPEETLDAILDNEICALKHGVFNLGFLAIRRSHESARFIDWWASRLYQFCYADIPGGLFTDQRWIDLAPCFYDTRSFRHPGYNMAPWNVSRRRLTMNSAGEYIVNGDYPLRFFHFSGFDSGANESMINKYCPDTDGVIYKLRNHYVKLCEEAGQNELGAYPWSYNFYSNGDPIPNSHRLIYRDDKELQIRFPNPFDLNSSEGSFLDQINLKNRSKLFDGKRIFKEGSIGAMVMDAYNRGGVGFVSKKVIEKLFTRR